MPEVRKPRFWEWLLIGLAIGFVIYAIYVAYWLNYLLHHAFDDIRD